MRNLTKEEVDKIHKADIEDSNKTINDKIISLSPTEKEPKVHGLKSQNNKEYEADVKYYYYTYAAIAVVLAVITFDVFHNVSGEKIENVPFYLKKSKADQEKEKHLLDKLKQEEENRRKEHEKKLDKMKKFKYI